MKPTCIVSALWQKSQKIFHKNLTRDHWLSVPRNLKIMHCGIIFKTFPIPFCRVCKRRRVSSRTRHYCRVRTEMKRTQLYWDVHQDLHIRARVWIQYDSPHYHSLLRADMVQRTIHGKPCLSQTSKVLLDMLAGENSYVYAHFLVLTAFYCLY